jgi:ATP-binding cassette subfamily B (MDR/TAP) protein 1
MTVEKFRSTKNWLLLLWCAWTLISVLITGTERTLFGVMGERLSYVLRLDLLKGIMYKQVSWFDREDRAPGILTNIMSENITELNGMTSETVVTVVEVIFSLTFGILGGFILCWQQAVIAFVLSPIAIGGAYAGTRIFWGKKAGK